MESDIDRLTKLIESNHSPFLVQERCKVYLKSGEKDKALMDFMDLLRSQSIKNILEFEELLSKFTLKEFISLLASDELLLLLTSITCTNLFLQLNSISNLKEWKEIYYKLNENSKFYLILKELNQELTLGILEYGIKSKREVGQELELEILSLCLSDSKVKNMLVNGLSQKDISKKVKEKVALLLIQDLKEVKEFTSNFLKEELVQFLKREKLRDLTSVLIIKISSSKDANEYKMNMFKNVKILIDSGLQVDKEFGFWILSDLMKVNQELGLEFLDKEQNLNDMMEFLDNDSELVHIAFMEFMSNIQHIKGLSKNGQDFLEKCTRQSRNAQKKSLAALILTKLSFQEDGKHDEQVLNLLLRELEIKDSAVEVKSSLIEALAVKSLQPAVKESLIEDMEFIQNLIQLSKVNEKSMAFGIINIFLNIGKYRERISQEQEQIKKLQQMSKGNTNAKIDDPLDDDKMVEKRNRKLLQFGVMEVIVRLSKDNPSEIFSDSLALCLLNLIVDKTNRGKVIQQGGLKTLLLLLKSASSKGIKDASQAVAKLLITTDPSLAFKGISALECIKPLIDLCRGNDLLCQFESLLALTNLASIGLNVQSRVIQGESIKTFESLIFSDNTLIRRAATELVCNLMYEPTVFERYVNSGQTSRLKLMIALSDCEDFETRRAASGVLAILSSSKEGLLSLSKEARFFEVLKTLMVEESLELLHRAFEVLRNCILNIRKLIPPDLIRCALGPLQRQIDHNTTLKPLSVEILSQIKHI